MTKNASKLCRYKHRTLTNKVKEEENKMTTKIRGFR